MGAIPNAELHETREEREWQKEREREERERQERKAAERARVIEQLRKSLFTSTYNISQCQEIANDFAHIQNNIQAWIETAFLYTLGENVQTNFNYAPAASYVIDTFRLINKLARFQFENQQITKSQLEALLKDIRDIAKFPHIHENESSSFVKKLSEFSTKLSRERLNQDEVCCLVRVLKEMDKGCLDFLDRKLFSKLISSDTLKPFFDGTYVYFSTQGSDFEEKMQQILNEKCFPYLRVTHPGLLESLEDTKNSDPILKFVFLRHEQQFPSFTHKSVQTYLHEKFGYYSHHEYQQGLARLEEVKLQLSKLLLNPLNYPFSARIDCQKAILDVLQKAIQENQEQHVLPSVAPRDVQIKYAAQLHRWFYKTKTTQLLEEMQQGYSESLMKTR